MEPRRYRRLHERIRPRKPPVRLGLDNIRFRRHPYPWLANRPRSLPEKIFRSRENGHSHFFRTGNQVALARFGLCARMLEIKTRQRSAARKIHTHLQAPAGRLADRKRSYQRGCEINLSSRAPNAFGARDLPQLADYTRRRLMTHQHMWDPSPSARLRMTAPLTASRGYCRIHHC